MQRVKRLDSSSRESAIHSKVWNGVFPFPIALTAITTEMFGLMFSDEAFTAFLEKYEVMYNLDHLQEARDAMEDVD